MDLYSGGVHSKHTSEYFIYQFIPPNVLSIQISGCGFILPVFYKQDTFPDKCSPNPFHPPDTHLPPPYASSLLIGTCVCVHSIPLSHIFFNSLYVTNDLFSLVLTSILCRSISTHLFIYFCPHIAIILSSFFPDYPTYLVRLIPVLFHPASCLLPLYPAVYCSS